MTIDPRRHLDLEGSHNVRDLGGYQTRDGGHTQWRRVWRSDGLHELSETGQSQLVGLGLRTVVDLRRGSELAAAPSVFMGSAQVAYHHLDMIGEGPIDASQPLDDSAHEIAATYCLWLDRRQDAIRAALSTLAAPGALPALFNCAAGKDRTGVMAALLLGLAGVPDEVIVEDYILSARYLLHRYLADLRARGLAHDGYGWEDYQEQFVPAQAMTQVLRHLQDRYGGIESYVRAIGLAAQEASRLRAGLLE